MKFKGEIEVKKFCETEKKGTGPIQEESLNLNFKVLKDNDVANGFENGCALIGMSPEEISDLIGDNNKTGIKISSFSGKKSGIYNIIINGYEFVGNTFSSFEVKHVKKIGNVIILRLRIPYNEDFHMAYPGFIRNVIDIEITEVNEQLTLTDPGKEETPNQDAQPNKTGKKYSLGRVCDGDDCEEPIRNDSKTGKCKEHR